MKPIAVPVPPGPSPLAPGCVAACRGCAHRALDWAESLAQKEAWLRRRLAAWDDVLQPVRSVTERGRWGYRDRVCLAAAWHDGEWHIGLRQRHDVVSIPQCPVHSERVRQTLDVLRDVLPPGHDFPLAYNVQAGAQLALVLKARELPSSDWLDAATASRISAAGTEALWIHLHPSAGHRVLARREWRLLWGTPRSTDAQGHVYGPAAFHQLLPSLYDESLSETQQFLATSPGDAVVDLYCGGGGSIARWLAAGASAIGVELDGEACACARVNVPGAIILRGTCAQRLPQLRAWTNERPGARRLLYANPPRTGLEHAVVEWIRDDYRPERMAYLSCSAGTLARDLEALQEGGLTVQHIVPFDFFPQTHHVETLVLAKV